LPIKSYTYFELKIAYLITAYGEFDHLTRLVGALDDEGVGFFIHVDAKSDMPEGLFAERDNVVLVPRRKVWWGGWSHVEAILLLMRTAAQDDFDYCVLLSGSDYPIRSNEVIRRTLAQGGQFINAVEGFRPEKPEKRVRRYRFDGFDRRERSLKSYFYRGVELALHVLGIHKRRYPFAKIWSGIVWSALSMDCVRYILKFVDDNPRFVSFFRTAQVPEEMFFHTIIGNSPFAGAIKGSLTYMDWDNSTDSPPFIDRRHLPKLALGRLHYHQATGLHYERMFARKFNDRSTEILDIIDSTLRK
jgi:hypothetical protein